MTYEIKMISKIRQYAGNHGHQRNLTNQSSDKNDQG